MSGRSLGVKLFRPILAGATARDRALACAGAFAGIALVGLEGAIVHGDAASLAWIVAPIGASAVLVFAVPASPMAQPWPVIGGNTISAAVGVVVAHLVPDRTVAGGLAVSLAVAAMSVTRTLHPPGGAAALTAVIGGSVVTAAGGWLPLVPVGMNAAILVAVGWGFHRISGHSYPHRATEGVVRPAPTRDPPPSRRLGLRAADVDAVLARVGDAFDISRQDLVRLLDELEALALSRDPGGPTCEQIMSRDVITVRADAEAEVARRLLLESGVRLLPVLDGSGHVAGAIGLRELMRPGRRVAELMSEALTIAPERRAIELTAALTDGHRHAAMVIDGQGELVGLVTQADLLAALARPVGLTGPR